MTKIIGDTGCPTCTAAGHDKTGNHLMLFEDGGAFCNRCNYSESAATFTEPTVRIGDVLTPEEAREQLRKAEEESSYKAINSRKISKETCELFGVRTQVSEVDGTSPVAWLFPRIAETEGGETELAGYKTRYAGGKWFGKFGNTCNPLFFGTGFMPKKGYKLFITEGEFDAMAVYEALVEFSDAKFKSRIAVYSLSNGSKSAGTEAIRNAKLLDNFKEIVLVFDQDKAGRDAVEDFCKVVSREKVKVAEFSENDPCKMLQEDKGRELYFAAISEAKKPRPEKIVSGAQISLEELRTPLASGLVLPYPKLQSMLHGLRHGEGGGELTVICAGTGMGKTTLAREIDYHLNKEQLRVGHIFLEEQLRKTGQSLIAIDNNVPLAALREDPSIISEEKFKDSYERLINNGRNFYLKHFGSLASDQLIDHLMYMGVHERCDFCFLDHISMVVSGQESGAGGERKDIDILMTRLAAFCEDSGVSVIAIVHLNRPSNGDFNGGSQISLNNLRGSGAIAQLAHNILAVEGDQQSEDTNARIIRVLKCREWGDVGVADSLEYKPTTGRLLPANVSFGEQF